MPFQKKIQKFSQKPSSRRDTKDDDESKDTSSFSSSSPVRNHHHLRLLDGSVGLIRRRIRALVVVQHRRLLAPSFGAHYLYSAVPKRAEFGEQIFSVNKE